MPYLGSQLRTRLPCSLLHFLLAACLFVMSSSTSFANDKAELADNLKQLQNDIGGLQKQIDKAQLKRNKLQKQLRRMERELSAASLKLDGLRRQTQQGRTRINSLENDERASNQRLSSYREQLQQQLHAAYVIGRQEQLKLLLNQEDPARMGRVLTWYGYVSKDRVAKINEVNQELQRLQEISSQLKLEQQRLTSLQSSTEQALAKLNNSKQERSALLARIDKNLAEQGSSLKSLRRQELELNEFIGSLQAVVTKAAPPPRPASSRPFAKQRGRLHWPARGKRLHSFGSARAGGKLRWNGVLIGAQLGDNVHAVDAGRVVYSDWLPRLGMLTIIDHGNEYLSLYAQNRSLLKEVGDEVARGEVIATVGDTGGQDSAGLYFEIRHRSKPVDPARWCRTGPASAYQ